MRPPFGTRSHWNCPWCPWSMAWGFTEPGGRDPDGNLNDPDMGLAIAAHVERVHPEKVYGPIPVSSWRQKLIAGLVR